MEHLETGGVLLVVAKTEETFQNNNFAYTDEKDGVYDKYLLGEGEYPRTVFVGQEEMTEADDYLQVDAFWLTSCCRGPALRAVPAAW